jgi:Hemerythrin HHE cation binding domain
MFQRILCPISAPARRPAQAMRERPHSARNVRRPDRVAPTPAAGVAHGSRVAPGIDMTVHAHAEGLDAGAANGPRLLLADHHREIDEACGALLACAHEDCSRSLTEQYRVFEQAVLEHLEAEETVILPDYTVQMPQDAYAIRAEHAAIRKLLSSTAAPFPFPRSSGPSCGTIAPMRRASAITAGRGPRVPRACARTGGAATRRPTTAAR